MRIAAHVSFANDHDARRRERVPAAFGVSLRDQEKLRIAVRIVDLSTDGCRLEFGGELPEGARIAIAFPGLEAWEARVVWSKRGSAGCKFVHPMHPTLVRRLCARDSAGSQS